MILETQRLRLRRPEIGDGQKIVAFLNDLSTARMMSRIPYPYRLDDWRRFVTLCERPRGEDAFVVTDRRDGRPMGVVGLQPGGETPVLGYWVGTPYRNRKVAREAATAILDYGFDAYDTSSIRSGHFVDNEPSARVLTSLGFERQGTSQQSSLARDEPIEHVDLRLTRAQWIARKKG